MKECVHLNWNLMVSEMIRRTDSGHHQNLRRHDGSGGEDDFVVGVRDLVLAVVLVLNAVRARPRIVSGNHLNKLKTN